VSTASSVDLLGSRKQNAVYYYEIRFVMLVGLLALRFIAFFALLRDVL
jgi:hypothetical protein